MMVHKKGFNFVWMHESDNYHLPIHPNPISMASFTTPLGQECKGESYPLEVGTWKNVDGIADHEADRALYLDSRLGKREILAAIAMDGSNI